MVKSVTKRSGNAYQVAHSHLITTCATLAALILFVMVGARSCPAPSASARAGRRLLPWRSPSYRERDVSDKPAWVRARPRNLGFGPQRLRRRQLQTLLKQARLRTFTGAGSTHQHYDLRHT